MWKCQCGKENTDTHNDCWHCGRLKDMVRCFNCSTYNHKDFGRCWHCNYPREESQVKNVRLGDIVRVSNPDEPDKVIEGTVMMVKPSYIGVKTFRDLNVYVDNDDAAYVKVLRRVEPKKVGSVYTDTQGIRWTKFTDNDNYNKQWISEYSLIDAWEDIR